MHAQREPDEPCRRRDRLEIREVVSFLEEDRELGPDIQAAVELVRDGALLDAVAKVLSLR